MKTRKRRYLPFSANSFAGRHVGDIADLLREAAQALQAAKGLFARGDADDALEIMIDHMPTVQEALTLMRFGVVAAIHPYDNSD